LRGPQTEETEFLQFTTEKQLGSKEAKLIKPLGIFMIETIPTEALKQKT
jgi:hypothetical protein